VIAIGGHWKSATSVEFVWKRQQHGGAVQAWSIGTFPGGADGGVREDGVGGVVQVDGQDDFSGEEARVIPR
jgi:hypothetical protein